MAYSSSNAQARAISHRTWSRKKAPISRVGSYDFNGGVDRATMKMHMAAADRPQGHTQVVTLWPLASTAIDKNECFAVREREVLWTMRPGKGMGRTSDGRMRALSSLNYFRLVLSDDQRDALAAAMGMQGQSPAEVMAALKSLVGPKRMELEATRVMTLDMLNKVDHLLRSYVLAVIQYAGVAITGEEAGSRQHLQGIAVTVGGLNTLANNSDKTLCPGMKLCMTVPRCVPDSTAWPAPCDHIGLPHGKVVPILRQADGTELMDVLMGPEKSSIYRHVAQLMTGCCSGSSMQTDVKDEDVPVDVYFAFTDGQNKEHRRNVSTDYSDITRKSANEILSDQLDVMRRMNDAVVFTMLKAQNKFKHARNTRYDNFTIYNAGTHATDNMLSFAVATKIENSVAAKGAEIQAGPTTASVFPMWRLLIIAFGNIRDIVLANAGSTSAGKTLKTKFYKGVTPLDDTQRAADNYVTDTMEAMFNTYYNKKIPDCLGQITMAQNSKDPDASQYAEMIVDIMSKVHSELSRNAITITNATAGKVVMPHKVVYNEMRAVSNGNASFGLAAKEIPSGTTLVETQLPLSETFQPNVVVLDPKVQYPWESSDIETITKSTGKKHSTFTLVFRSTFQAPFRLDPVSEKQHIQVSDNEVPFVGAWLAVPSTVTLAANTPYRSDFMPDRFMVANQNNVKYYYLTWSAFVHTVCHNVLQQHDDSKKILEMNPAELVTNPHYTNSATDLEPTINSSTQNFGTPGLGSFLHAILRPDTDATTQYQDYLRKHSPIASLVKNVVQATVQAVTQHQLTTEKKTVGMALSSAARGEAVDVVLTGAV